MKKALSLGMLITLMVVLHPSQKTIATQQQQPAQQAGKGFFYYTWYHDQDATQPVGTENTVNAEMARLRAMYSLYIFSAQPESFLTEFEYGYYAYFSAIIYSNCPFTLKARIQDSVARKH